MLLHSNFATRQVPHVAGTNLKYHLNDGANYFNVAPGWITRIRISLASQLRKEFGQAYYASYLIQHRKHFYTWEEFYLF